ncbi:hypothetical protein IW261DRAFT_1424873 [Armillaria novae-zelandiae]|uniref:Uncharacterized protein n=1 Tax=Armillaria novae-zelandiae TaxID=153914 RepID=A0AA39NU30_9AGAR|nr:hypothetical protein IW261DRAFT_1424873 [Armillaria novae-zelandiae]
MSLKLYYLRMGIQARDTFFSNPKQIYPLSSSLADNFPMKVLLEAKQSCGWHSSLQNPRYHYTLRGYNARGWMAITLEMEARNLGQAFPYGHRDWKWWATRAGGQGKLRAKYFFYAADHVELMYHTTSRRFLEFWEFVNFLLVHKTQVRMSVDILLRLERGRGGDSGGIHTIRLSTLLALDTGDDAASMELSNGFKHTFCCNVQIEFMGMWFVSTIRILWLLIDISVGIQFTIPGSDLTSLHWASPSQDPEFAATASPDSGTVKAPSNKLSFCRAKEIGGIDSLDITALNWRKVRQ